MVEAPLVIPDVEFGDDILRHLDAAKFPATAALWAQHDNDWNLIIGTALVDKLGLRRAYLRLREALSTDGPVAVSSLPIRLYGNRDPLIKDLRRTFGTAESVRGMRLGGHSIGDRWIQDAYVYRLKK